MRGEGIACDEETEMAREFACPSVRGSVGEGEGEMCALLERLPGVLVIFEALPAGGRGVNDRHWGQKDTGGSGSIVHDGKLVRSFKPST